MHQAQNYIDSNLLIGLSQPNLIVNHSISSSQASALLNRLHSDAVDYLYSSIISIGDAVSGIANGLYTWSTVKLYYATFYAFRSLLALEKVCIFYIGRKAYALDAIPGGIANKRDGQTHKVVLNEFRSRAIAPFLLSQTIDLSDPLTWLTERREEANYKNPKFCEPTVPQHFEKVVDTGIRISLKEYLSDTSGLYLFDPDHAMLAYPVSGLRVILQKVASVQAFMFTSNEVSYLCGLFNDRLGPIPEINEIFKSCLNQ